MRFFLFLFLLLSFYIKTQATDFIIYISGNNSLSTEATALNTLISHHPVNSHNRLIATVKTPTSNMFIVRGKGQALTASLPDSDYGLPETLSAFLKKAEQYRTTDLSVLILWGHGTSWYPENNKSNELNRAIGRDTLFGNALFFDQANELIVFSSHYDIVVADACHYAASETIYAFRNTADIFIGSGHLIPADAFDYSIIFSTISSTTSNIISSFFDAFQPYTDFSLSAVDIPLFCNSIRTFLGTFPFQTIDRTTLLGIDGNDTYSSNTSDVDIKPFFDSPEWLLRHSSSESSLLGISLFFPPSYTIFKQYFSAYYTLSFQKDTDILAQVAHFYNKDEIPPILEKAPIIEQYKNSVRISDTKWYDSSTVIPSLLGVQEEYKYPLTTGITNNSGYAGLQSGVVKINVTDSVLFSHGNWSSKGFLSFTFSYTLRYTDTLLISYETDTGWHEYASYAGIGKESIALYFPSGTLRVRFSVDGTLSFPLYKGVEITSFNATHLTGEERIISPQWQILSNFQYPSYYLLLSDSFGNTTISALHLNSSKSKQILYYPNPTHNGIIFFDTRYSQIEVFTSSGKRILTIHDTDTINISRFARGLYYIKIGDSIVKVIYL